MKHFVGLEQMIDIIELDCLLSFVSWIEVTCDEEFYNGEIPKRILTYGKVMAMSTNESEFTLLPYSGGKIKARLSDVGVIEISGKNFFGKVYLSA